MRLDDVLDDGDFEEAVVHAGDELVEVRRTSDLHSCLKKIVQRRDFLNDSLKESLVHVER